MIYKARLPNLATDIAWERIKKFSHTNPTCLSNANYGKKTFSLLRCICISHFKSSTIRGYERNTLSQEFFGGITVLLLMLSLKSGSEPEKGNLWINSTNEDHSRSLGSFKCEMKLFGRYLLWAVICEQGEVQTTCQQKFQYYYLTLIYQWTPRSRWPSTYPKMNSK